MNILKENLDEDFDNFKLIEAKFKDIKDFVHGGTFLTEDGKNKLFGIKIDFFVILKSLLQNNDIYQLPLDGYVCLGEFKMDKETDLSKIRQIYDVLNFYFKYNQKQKTKDVYLNDSKEKLVNNLENIGGNNSDIKRKIVKDVVNEKKTNLRKNISISWQSIGDVLGFANLSEDNCYELFNEYSWSNIGKEKIEEKLLYLRNIVKQRLINGEDMLLFVKFLIRNFDEYSKNYDEKIEQEKKDKIIANSKKQLERYFLLGLKNFDNFIQWFDNYLKENLDMTNVSSIKELKNNENLFNEFIIFRNMFVETYNKEIKNYYKDMFENKSGLDYFYYGNVLAEISRLGELYLSDRMSDEQFFLGIKRGFLIGDIIDFLRRKKKEFSISDSNFSEILLNEIKQYELK